MPATLTIAGNLCAEPQLRKTNSGLEIVELRIASDQGKDNTVYWTAKFLGNKAGETALKYAKVGSSVFVSGAAEEEKWEKDGVKHSKIVCVANLFNFLSSGKKDSETKPESKTSAKTAGKPAAKSTEEEFDSDVPF